MFFWLFYINDMENSIVIFWYLTRSHQVLPNRIEKLKMWFHYVFFSAFFPYYYCIAFEVILLLFWNFFVFHVDSTFFHLLSPACSLYPAPIEVVACLFACPRLPTLSLILLRPWPFLQNSLPHPLQTCPPTPLPHPPAHPSQLRGTLLRGASPRPWRLSYPFTQPLLSPGPGNGGPVYLPCSPPL